MPFNKYSDMIGLRINDIEILSFAGYKGNPPRGYYNVRCCRCGKVFEMRRNKFKDTVRPPVACYECIKNKYSDPEYINEIIGQKVNMLTCEKFVCFREVHENGRNKLRRQAMYLCRCECGGTTVLERNTFLKGMVKSCGCQNVIGVVKHDCSRSRLYTIYQDMKSRCYNPNETGYSHYGGRGIKVCDEWLDPNVGFMRFRNWALANGYQDSLSIERINVNGNYEPSNCTWISMADQAWNKQNTVRTEISGINYNSKQIKEMFNSPIPVDTLSRRLNNEGGNYFDWSLNDKLFIPLGITRAQFRKEHNITNPIEFLK